ncbi:hypothetical protein [Yersinia sp. 2105 StPb PI]|uniref:hypothetical protein n=1 Tax=Yersinia sp. 2105 StPb PI TaxID=2507058 RepID=UPI000FFBC4F5|nr:hypothetical protein [Yersinia sp. 2105 StPb PI]RXA97389.1 hypothetical protein EQP49_03465 [Yersinia sp. 2105 StPb PI]
MTLGLALRPWRYSVDSGVPSPESLTRVSSSGFAHWLPSCNTNDFGACPAALALQRCGTSNYPRPLGRGFL